MSDLPQFDNYLASKMIDPEAFKKAEPDVWAAWESEFEQMHPVSFSLQKLNLLTVVRRKYLLRMRTDGVSETTSPASPQAPVKPSRPVMRPKAT